MDLASSNVIYTHIDSVGEQIFPRCTSSPLGPQEHLKDLPKASPASTLSPSAPLATLSSSVTLAYFLGWRSLGRLI